MAPSDERNPGIPLDLTWVHEAHVNKSGIDRRAAEIGTRRGVKKQFQAGWLLRAVTNIDLTTLAGDDTPSNVQRLCAKAKAPIRKDILEKLGCADLNITCGAVCVYPARVKDAVAALEGTGIPVAAVATGFPSGQIKHEHKLEEIRGAVADGATEIDIVINREAALAGDWERVYHEVQDFREACGEAHMKSILAVGELHTLTNVHRASLVCMMAGSDFIKTSTGKEPVNATIANSLVMLRSLREYLQMTGYKVGFKPAGGISKAKAVLQYQSLMKEELGDEWLDNHLFRVGASSLLTDIERQLYHAATNEYAADHYMPMG
jgi:deoxyribose-phosphate aldolase